jgi:hypothetical protein
LWYLGFEVTAGLRVVVVVRGVKVTFTLLL